MSFSRDRRAVLQFYFHVIGESSWFFHDFEYVSESIGLIGEVSCRRSCHGKSTKNLEHQTPETNIASENGWLED